MFTNKKELQNAYEQAKSELEAQRALYNRANAALERESQEKEHTLRELEKERKMRQEAEYTLALERLEKTEIEKKYSEEIEGLKENTDHVRAEKRRIADMLNAEQREHFSLKSKFDGIMIQHHEELLAQKSALEQEHNHKFNQLEKSVEEMKTTIENHLKSEENLNKEIEELESKMQSMQVQKSEIQERIGLADQTVQSLKDEILSKDKENENMQNKIEEIHQQMEQCRVREEEISLKFEVVKKEKESVVEELRVSVEKCKDLERMIENLQEDLRVKEDLLVSERNELQQLKQSAEVMHAKGVEAFSKEISNLKACIQDLEGKLHEEEGRNGRSIIEFSEKYAQLNDIIHNERAEREHLDIELKKIREYLVHQIAGYIDPGQFLHVPLEELVRMCLNPPVTVNQLSNHGQDICKHCKGPVDVDALTDEETDELDKEDLHALVESMSVKKIQDLTDEDQEDQKNQKNEKSVCIEDEGNENAHTEFENHTEHVESEESEKDSVQLTTRETMIQAGVNEEAIVAIEKEISVLKSKNSRLVQRLNQKKKLVDDLKSEVKHLESIKEKVLYYANQARVTKKSKVKVENQLKNSRAQIKELEDQVSRLDLCLRQEMATRRKSSLGAKLLEKQMQELKVRNQEICNKSMSKTKSISELKEGSRILEDQLRLLDTKYVDLRGKLDYTREQHTKEKNIEQKAMSILHSQAFEQMHVNTRKTSPWASLIIPPIAKSASNSHSPYENPLKVPTRRSQTPQAKSRRFHKNTASVSMPSLPSQSTSPTSIARPISSPEPYTHHLYQRSSGFYPIIDS